MGRILGVAICWLAGAACGWPQDDMGVFRNAVLDENIRTVQCFRGVLEVNFPYLGLVGDAEQLHLQFDELGNNPSQLEATFVHCNADWRRSDLIPVDFMEGLETQRLLFPQASQLALQPYFHYRFAFPSNGVRFKVSGNYAVLVAREDEPHNPILVQRFLVVDNQVGILLDPALAAGGAQRFRLQQINFSVVPNRLQVLDPRRDFKAVVLQNFRWDNASAQTEPFMVLPDRLDYSLNTNSLFEGGNEFRMIDLRSTRTRPSPRLTRIYYSDTATSAFLDIDRPRGNNSYLAELDFNGWYYIGVREFPNAATEADYIRVRFRLAAPERQDRGTIHIFGALSGWAINPRFAMVWNPASRLYEADVQLKQGVYDYQYVVGFPNGRINETELEGSHAETENYYTVLVYFRGIADRADRLVGLRNVNFYD